MIRLLLLCIALLCQPVFARPATGIAAIATRLDLTSFPNSTGPRRQPGLVTPAEYGFTSVEIDGSSARLTAEGRWLLAVSLLEDSEQPIVCITDRAMNGGSYFTVTPVRLAPAGKLYRVVEILPDRPDCKL